MKVSYRPTYDQFTENYLATHYSGGVRTLQRIIGGPALIVAGALVIIITNDRVAFWLFRYPLFLIGLIIALYGVGYTLGPLFNLFLVWLRRTQLFDNLESETTLELKGKQLLVTQNKETIKVPLTQVQSVQHRSTSTWILTESDNLIYIPRQGLLSGDHDKFVQKLEEILAPEEPEAKEQKKSA